MPNMKNLCDKIINSRGFEFFIVAVILLNAVVLGLETYPDMMQSYSHILAFINNLVLVIFIVEAIMKMIALAPQIQRYFASGWNLFDFSVILASLIPATGEFAMIARLARLLRVMRLISTIPELRLIVTTLVRSLPGMFHVILLMSVIFYIYAVVGFHLYHEHDPVLWGSLGTSLLTLFRVVTLEDWTDVMYTAMELHHLSWMYFVSFVVVGTFVVINLFIAVVLNNLEEAKQERLQSLQQPPSKDEILRELQNTQQALKKLQNQLEQSA